MPIEKRTYSITLLNRDENLNLQIQKNKIYKVLKEIQEEKKDLIKVTAIDVKHDSIEITVKESGNHWHTKFGNKLANEHNMRQFCKDGEKSKMFKWS